MKPEDGKGIYDSIEIPEELDQIVRQSIAEAEKGAEKKKQKKKNLTKTEAGMFERRARKREVLKRSAFHREWRQDSQPPQPEPLLFLSLD